MDKSRGPELSSWMDSGRARFIAATDAQALDGFHALATYESIIPALESSHAVYNASKIRGDTSTSGDHIASLAGCTRAVATTHGGCASFAKNKTYNLLDPEPSAALSTLSIPHANLATMS